MEQNKKLGNAAEDATQLQNLENYKKRMKELAELLGENKEALNKFADLYREDFGQMLKENTSVRQISISMNNKESNTEIELKYSNRFYMLKEVMVMLQQFLRNEGRGV